MKTPELKPCPKCHRPLIHNAAEMRKALESTAEQEEWFHRHLNNDQYARAGDAIEYLSEASGMAKEALGERVGLLDD